MARKVTIMIIHGRIRHGAKLSNMRAIKRFVNEVMEQEDKNIDVLVLPPYPFTGPIINYTSNNRVKEQIRNSAEMLSRKASSNRTLEFLERLATEFDVAIVTGPMIERAGPRLYITSVYIDRYGYFVDKYRKIAVTKQELSHNIYPGNEPGVFVIGPSMMRLGVFIDEDLAYPEIFRAMQANGVNFIIGFMLPYMSDYFKITIDDKKMTTMDESLIKKFISVRLSEVGVPMVLVGGVVEPTGSSYIAYMKTIPADPDVGIIENKIKGPNEATTYFTIEINVDTSHPRPLNPSVVKLYKKIFQRRTKK